MPETPFFFQNGDYRLFGVLHEAKSNPLKEGFVFCAPFAEEKLWAHRVLVNFARVLADRGYSVLRFDYMGNGDSEGKFGESSLETMLSDTKCAIRTLRQKSGGIESVNLLGLRLGATIAALSTEKKGDAKKLILWEPIINGSSYMREMLRINLSTQTAVYKKILHNTDALVQMMKEGKTVNVDGYEMAWPLYEQIAKIDMLSMSNTCEGSVLIVHINRKDGSVIPVLGKLKDKYSRSNIAVSVEEPFWKEIRQYYSRADSLFRITMNWLKENER
jgi:exosortase A-associated hydrolase 2